MHTATTIDQRGFVALITVLLISAIIITFGLSVALMNADEVLVSFSNAQQSFVRSGAQSCVQNALNRLRNNNSVSGNVNVNTSNVNCVATIAGASNTRTINASATTTDPFNRNVVSRGNVNVNIATNPFTIIEYKDILD